MPTIEAVNPDYIGIAWLVACFVSTAAVLWNIYRAPLEREDYDIDQPDIDDHKVRMSWHKEQAEAVLDQACRDYGVDYRDQHSPLVDTIECYLDNSSMSRQEFDRQVDEIRRADLWQKR